MREYNNVSGKQKCNERTSDLLRSSRKWKFQLRYLIPGKNVDRAREPGKNYRSQ